MAFCGMLAEDLGIEAAAARRAFIGEPKVRCIRVVEWAMRHEPDDPEKRTRMVLAWARKRGAGAFGEREDAEVEVARAIARYWTEHPDRLAQVLREALPNGKTGTCSGCGRRFPNWELVELGEGNHDGLTYFDGDRLCRECADGAGVEH